MTGFFEQKKPLLVSMIQARRPVECISMIRNSIYDGADAFAIQICQIERKLRTEENLKEIFAATGGRPTYVTNYVGNLNRGMDDEWCMEGLLTGMRCGGMLADVPGNIYDRDAALELTYNPEAVRKQKDLIDQIHGMGKEVLMSSHTRCYLSCEKVLEIAYAQQERGADVVKIVTKANSMEEQMDNLRTTTVLKDKLKVPFIFLSGGTHYRLHRMTGIMLGCSAAFCVQRQDELSAKEQPLLRNMRMILDHTDYLTEVLV